MIQLELRQRGAPVVDETVGVDGAPVVDETVGVDGQRGAPVVDEIVGVDGETPDGNESHVML